jgi:hypothetical protein
MSGLHLSSLSLGAPSRSLAMDLQPARGGHLVDQAGSSLEDELGNLLTGTVVTDDPGRRLAELASLRGITFGSAVQSDASLAKPGPAGVGSLGDFLGREADLYVPGTAMLPHHIQYNHGVFDTGPLAAFLARVVAEGKQWRGHVLLYPAKDRPWVGEVVNAGNLECDYRGRLPA